MLKTFIIMFLVYGLVGCGQAGRLYLPENAPQIQNTTPKIPL